MLTVRVSISPSMATRSRSAFWRVPASSSADSAPIVGGGDDDEFVAAEPGDQAAIAGLLAQTFGEHPDEPVAGVMAEIVVDGLEPVQVEEQHCDGSAPAGRQAGVEMGHECAAIVHAGQVVVFGQIPQLVLGQDAGLHLGEQ